MLPGCSRRGDGDRVTKVPAAAAGVRGGLRAASRGVGAGGGAAGRKAKGRQQGCAASGTPSGGPSQATARPAPGHSDSRLQSSLPASPPTDTALSWPTLTSLLPRALEEVTWSRTWPVTSRRDPGTCSASPSPGTLPWKGDGTTVLTPWNEGRARCGHARKPSSAAPGAREEQHLAAAVALVPGVRGRGQGAQSVPPQPGAVGTLEHVAPAPRRPVPPQAEPISPPPPAPPPASEAAFSEVSSRPAVPPNFGAPHGASVPSLPPSSAPHPFATLSLASGVDRQPPPLPSCSCPQASQLPCLPGSPGLAHHAL